MNFAHEALDKEPAMQSLDLNAIEKKLLTQFLDELEERFGVASCNDFTPNQMTAPERQLMSQWIVGDHGEDCSGVDIVVLRALRERLSI